MPIKLTEDPTVSDQIPRRKTSSGGEGGPLVIPPGAQHIPGTKRCDTCGRMVDRVKPAHRKGTCKCMWYQRTTTFIDVMQDEFLLKQWGNRNVAWGMSQRPDLQLLAASCQRPHLIESGSEDYRELNNVVAEAQREAGDKIKATIGTSLHKITHQMDRGETLGKLPERWNDDIKAYDQWVKTSGIEWVSIESFRVLDKWVKNVTACETDGQAHKLPRYGGTCTCYGVAGTVDRIGWYRGRLVTLDIKTGSDFNKLGHAMQLAAYSRMCPYNFPGDVRGEDISPVNQDVGYIIYLPEGKGECKLEPVDLQLGWQACEIAKQVWDARKWNVLMSVNENGETEHDVLWRIAMTANTVAACKQFWRIWDEDGALTEDIKNALRTRAKQLGAKVTR